jgi:hypothetical protein
MSAAQPSAWLCCLGEGTYHSARLGYYGQSPTPKPMC